MKSKKRKTKPNASGTTLHRGVIEITRSGMGYVTVENLHKDILVKPLHFGNAVNGDRIEV